MLKITAIGNLTNDVELKMNEATGKPYAILRIASTAATGTRRATGSLILSPLRCAAPWRSGAPPLPGRAASWLLWATLRRSPSRMIPPGSPAS